MTNSLEKLRRKAKQLKRAHETGEAQALERLRAHPPRDEPPFRHADYLHVIAQEQGFASWPKLKLAIETVGMDRAQKQQRLRVALFHGQNHVVEHLLQGTPDLASGALELEIALYDLDAVRTALARDPGAAVRALGPRRPILHLAFSHYIHARPDLEPQMLAIADSLVKAGADVNDAYFHEGDPNSPLSALYGAIGHAGNMVLAEWLLDHGADPNDGESLYHATELGHRDGLRLLLRHGARPQGTNALPRALDFNDREAVELLLAAGTDPNEGIGQHPSGEPSFVIPALHQAARRMCDADIIGMLLRAGADPSMRYRDMTPYSMARVYGNPVAAEMIAAAGGDTGLGREEHLLIAAAEDSLPDGQYIDPEKLPLDYRNLIRAMLHMPGKLAHVQRLVAIGLEYDRPDEMGLTPVQIAGWEGLPDVMGYFLGLRPDLSHINGYGGTLLSTIIHGSENCPARAERDHIGCARLALEQGVALPKRAITFAGEPEMVAFLAEWAEARPGQVVEGGIA